MPVKITVTKVHRGPSVKFILSILTSVSSIDTENEALSEEMNINDLALVRFECKAKSSTVACSISLKKHKLAKNVTVKAEITCEELEYSRQWISTDNWREWIDIGTTYKIDALVSNVILTVLVINVSFSEVEAVTFAKLYEEKDFSDFNLSTEGGSVAVHRACLAVHSDMFKRMLSGEWKETVEHGIEIKGVSLQTLRQLKEYIYLGTLPDSGLRALLLLAKCYLIENCKAECIVKLAQTVGADDLYSLLEFAVDNRIPELIRAIVQMTPNGIVQKAYQMESRKVTE